MKRLQVLLVILLISFGSRAQGISITEFCVKTSFQDSCFSKLDSKIDLDYRKTSVLIRFKDKADSLDTNFEYKLVGYDNKWIKIGGQSSCYFVNLFGGEYEFLVRNIENPKLIASIKFEIEQAFWQQPWFYFGAFGYLILIAGIIYFLFQNARLKANNLNQTLRNEISSDLHDDMGSTLANIRFITEIAQQRLREHKTDDVARILEKILEHSKIMVHTMRGMIWSIKPDNDSTIDFFEKVRNIMFEFLSNSDVRIKFDVEIGKDHKLGLDIQRNLFLIIKEATHNIVKYAQASKVDFIVRVKNNWLMIQLKDNGKGFDQEILNDGNGLVNIKMRVEQLDGSLEIVSSEGVLIRIAIPLF